MRKHSTRLTALALTAALTVALLPQTVFAVPEEDTAQSEMQTITEQYPFELTPEFADADAPPESNLQDGSENQTEDSRFDDTYHEPAFLMNGSAAAQSLQSGTCGENLTWELSEDGTLTISGTGDMTNWKYNSPWDGSSSITSVVIEKGVTSIGDYAFFSCSSLTSVTIPDSVTSIGREAIYNCSSLTSVTIPDSVTSIGREAFYNCSSLTSVTIPDSMTSIGQDVFRNCSSLASVTIPGSVTSIGISAFSGCSSLTSVTIPDGVTSIGNSAFYNCTGLTSVTIPGSVTSIGSAVFAYCDNLKTAGPIGGGYHYEFGWKEVIPENAFYSCYGLTSIMIPDGVTSIGNSAFFVCSSLTSVTIPDGVTSIGSEVFGHCRSLTSVTIPDSVTSIGDYAFSNCSSLTSVTIPDSVTSIGREAFYNCSSLTSVTIPDSVTSIGSEAFYNCSSLTSVTIPDSMTSIGQDVFRNCSSLTSVTIPGSVTSIGISAFSGCSSLTSVTIPDGVTSIGHYAFYKCTGLTSVTIPGSVTSIGGEVFAYCDNLKTAGPIGGGYHYEFGWKEVIPGNAFSYCSSLTSVTIPDSVTSIGNSAFYGCSSLTSVTIPDSVTSIGNSAFSYCSSLTSVTIPDGVTSIGDNTFEGCIGLTSVTIPDSVTSIGNSAFYECRSLTSVTIPDSVTSIGDYAFSGCSELVLTVGPDSYAERYAIENSLEYKYITEDGESAEVKLLTDEGAELTDGYTVNWYDGSSLIGTGNKLTYPEGTSGIRFEIELSEENSFVYYRPEGQTVESGVYEVRLEKIPSIPLTGSVTDSEGKPLAGAKVSITQSAMSYERKTSVNTDENGNYSASILSLPTRAEISADGYYKQLLIVIESNADKVESAEMGSLTLTQIPKNKITVSLSLVNAAEEGEEGKAVSLSNANGLEFSVYNETKNREITDLTVQYPYIILGDRAADGYDVITISVSDRSKTMTAAPVTIALDKQKIGSAEIILIQNGSVKADILGSFPKIAMIFDRDGALCAKQFISGTSFVSGALPSGEYSIVFVKETDHLTSVANISKLHDLGLSQGTDYIASSATIASGVISDLGVLTAPDFDESKLYYTKNDSTHFSANDSSVPLGKYITLKAEYEIDEKYENSNQTVTIEIPEGLDFAENSVTINGKAGIYSYENGVLTVITNEPKGIVRFYCIAVQKGDYDITAYLSFVSGGKLVQPIGSAHLEAVGEKINVQQIVSSKRVTVTGSAFPKSNVTLFENGKEVGTAVSNSAGSWSIAFDLSNTFNYTYHDIYAEIENSRYEGTIVTDTETIVYDVNHIGVKRVTMYNTGDNGQNVTVFDYQNPGNPGQYSMWPGRYTSFTFVIEFEGDPSRINDVVLNVFVRSGNVYSYNADYDSVKDAWIVNTDFSSFHDAPINVGVEYTCAELDDFDYSATSHEDAKKYNEQFLNQFNELLGDLISAEIKEKRDGEVVLSCSIGGDEDMMWDMTVKELDYSSIDTATLEEQGFVLCEADDPSQPPQYQKMSVEGADMVYTLLDKEYEYAFSCKVSLDFMNENTEAKMLSLLSYENMSGLSRALWDVSENFPVPLVSEISAKIDYDNLRKLLGDKQGEYDRRLAHIVSLLTKKCASTGEFRLSERDMETFTKRYEALRRQGDYTYHALESELDLYAQKIGNALALDAITFGIGEILGSIGDTVLIHVNSKNAEYAKFLLRGGKGRRELTSFICGATFDVFTGLGQYVDGLEEFFNHFDVSGSQYWLEFKENYSQLDMLADMLETDIYRAYRECDGDPGDDEPGRKKKSPDKDKTPILDPSGYVCEAVSSNRLAGVTTTLYYEGDVLDDFGEPTGEKKAVLWDAAEYDQENPLITDVNGTYAWDVPEGQWQVKYEKENYETAYSEWLPVPPPQTEVHLAMVSNAAPTVKAVNAYTTGVRIAFSQYMDISSVNTDNVKVSINGSPVSGTIKPLNNEASFDDPEVEYASIFMFVPDSEISGNAAVEIKNVANYNSTALESACNKTVPVEDEPESIEVRSTVNVAYNGETVINLQILPAKAGANKKISVTASSPSIAAAVADAITTDENGNAAVKVSGKLPGSGEISFALDGTDITAITSVTVSGVNQPAQPDKESCKKVTADIVSGTAVEKGAKVTLTTETEGAEIYYTLDKTCPCVIDSPSRLQYTEPITINEDIYIIAYAVKDGFEDSPTEQFSYTIKTTPSQPSDVGGGSDINTKTITVQVTDKDGNTVHVSESIDKDGTVVLTLPTGKTLDGDNYYTITITDRSGKAKSDVDITLKDKNGKSASGTTDQDGKLILPADEHKAYIVGYGDGEFKPESYMTRAEAAAIFARNIAERKGESITNNKSSFQDVNSNLWYSKYIAYLEKHDIIEGYDDGTFKPEESITRAEFVTMCARFYNLFDKTTDAESNTFTDVASAHWAYKFINSAAAMDWIRGYADGRFKPDNNITRAEVVAIVNRATEREADIEYINKNLSSLNRFDDLTDAGYWAYYPIMEAANTHKAVNGAGGEIWVK